MTALRRLDHVAIAVRATDEALEYFSGKLGLEVSHSEEIASPHVRLTYLDAGNTYIQLVEPLDSEAELSQWLAENGEGLHHICFAVDDVLATVRGLSLDGGSPPTVTARGRMAAFVPGARMHGVVVECTEFRKEDESRTART